MTRGNQTLLQGLDSGSADPQLAGLSERRDDTLRGIIKNERASPLGKSKEMSSIQIPGFYWPETLARFIDSEIKCASEITSAELRERVIADLKSILICIQKLGGIPRSGLILNIRRGVIYLELPQQTLSRLFYTCDGGYQADFQA